jgi:hypothetical protein
MGTQYSEIYELFLASIKDYVIDKLFIQDLIDDTNKAEQYILPYLIKSIPKFNKCKKDLENRNDTDMYFADTLTTTEIVILADLMVVEWLRREVNDIRQMKLRLTDDAYKSHAEANNLNAKVNLMSMLVEDVDIELVRYSQDNINWATDFG